MTEKNVETDEFSNLIQKLLKSFNITKTEDPTIFNSHISSKGNNYMGELKQIRITEKDENNKKINLNLFVKIAPTHPVWRSCYSIKEAYDREILIYESVLPLFVKLQLDHNIKEPFGVVPKYYFSSCKMLNEMIFLEDMNVSGYEKYDRDKTFDYNHALLVIKELGKFHAYSFALREENKEIFNEIARNTRDVEFFCEAATFRLKLYSAFLVDVMKLFDDPADQIVCKKFEYCKINLQQILKEAVLADGIEEHAVIGHCDVWTTNMLFKYDKASPVPLEVCLLDWQMAKLCSPALDLSQFLFSCCDKKLRQQHYTNLIEEYYSSFSTLLSQFGKDPVQLFPFATLQDHLKKYSVYGLFSAIKVIGLVSVSCTDAPDLSSIKSSTEVANSFLTAKRDPTIFDARMKDVILDFLDYGYNL